MPTTRSKGKAPEAWIVDVAAVRHEEPPRSPSIATRSTYLPRPPTPPRPASRHSSPLRHSPPPRHASPLRHSPPPRHASPPRLASPPRRASPPRHSTTSRPANSPRRVNLPRSATSPRPATLTRPANSPHRTTPPRATGRPASISTPTAYRDMRRESTPNRDYGLPRIENRTRTIRPAAFSTRTLAHSVEEQPIHKSRPASVKNNRKAIKAREDVLRLKLQLAELELQKAEDYIDSDYEDDARSKADYVRSWVEDAPRPVPRNTDTNKQPEDRPTEDNHDKETRYGDRSPSIKIERDDDPLRSFVSQLTKAITTLADRKSDTPSSQPHPAVSKVIMALPTFSGAHTEWLSFKAMYDTTKTYFNNVENTARLRRSLKGRALEAVNSELIGESNPAEIMKELELQFGRPDSIAQAEIDKIKSLPRCTEAPRDICTFANKVRSAVITLSALRKDHYLINAEVLRGLTEKLPNSLRSQWYRAYTEQFQSTPDLKCFSEFISEQARYCSAFAPAENVNASDSARRTVQRTLIVSKDSDNTTKVRNCKICTRDGHFTSQCDTFIQADSNKRWELAKRHALCFRCLKVRSRGHSCKSKQCGVDGCSRTHHQSLHFKQKGDSTSVKDPTETVASSSARTKAQAFLKIVPVCVSGPAGEVRTYALLDDGSTVSLVDEELVTQVGAPGKPDPLNIKAIGDTSIDLPQSYRIKMKLRGQSPETRTFDISARTVPNLKLTPQRVSPRDFRDCKHLKDLSASLSYKTAVPRVLIGQDNWHLLIASETRRGPSYQPVASLTPLGWVLHGARSRALGQRVHFMYQLCNNDDSIDRRLKEYFALESIIVNPRRPKSDPEKQAEEILHNSVCRLEDGRVQTGLLWKNNTVSMPDSYENAVKRLLAVERKIDKHPGLKANYNQQLEDLVRKGYAEEAPVEKTPGKTWYLPHFDVHNPAKPNKLRIVHDAAAKSKGMSLNDYLLTGPDLLQSLPGVMMRFRRHPIAVTADIAEMFMQVRVQPCDRDALRYLWRGDVREGAPREYRMCSIIFGAASSPCTAIFAKNWNAEQYTKEYPRAVKAIVKNHYMDDYLDSFETEEEAVSVATQVKEIHQKACFVLRKWMSTHTNIARALEPEAVLSTNDTTVKLINSEEKILGLMWDPQRDTFAFNMKLLKLPSNILHKQQHTKREALKIVMSLYDPLGLASPVTIKAKQILQEAWRQGTGWDETLPESLAKQWTAWLQQLHRLNNIKIPRCYAGYSAAANVQLHVFTDASELAYAAVAYWRTESEEGHVNVSLVMAKARVAPLKITSIPRLELQAAVLGTRIAAAVKEEHEIDPPTIYWTDSKTVLTWIKRGSRSYKPFVAHRLAEIEESSKVNNWRWVPSKINIADAATRDVPSNFESAHAWYTGPIFLRLSEKQWPSQGDVGDTQTGEERVNIVRLEQQLKVSEAIPDATRFSKWERLVRTTARVLQFIQLCKKHKEHVLYKRTRKNLQSDPDWRRNNNKIKHRAGTTPQTKKKRDETTKHKQISAELLRSAERLLVKATQEQTFHREIAALTGNIEINFDSKLRQIPIELTDGIITIKSRISAAEGVGEYVKRPPVIDGDNKITQLYIEWTHRRLHHSGTETTINEIRQHYWVLRLRPVTKKIIFQCLMCRIRRAAPPQPATGNHPKSRLAHHQRPFTYTGLDYFGPLSVTVGRQHHKRYVALFTCLTSRAVHLEVAASLSADSCIMALRRFAARRGCPAEIYSDNGTNMHGADKEMREAVADEANSKGIVWRFITPSAPFMGGAWERLVRCVKTALYTVLNERHPSEEVLTTLLCEVEYTVNSRPLTHVSVDLEEEESITPNHILLGGSARLPPIGYFTDADSNSSKYWRRAQTLADMFWRRWVREYLPELQHRREPHGTGLKYEVGDPVLIADGQLPRNSWPRGRITATYPGPDGQVRTVEVRTAAGILKRPVKKLVPLPK
ncbi:uncharacterized protein LOC111356792 [Spodoptera litura]|uniref:Uncharacterized protein LOC111356792 n=1 Tax=Spodoptera litura TaxID=69820 RepID=A0A9J7EEX1_SPOLT|nr:uncharacterized protein LOC111356792 [Spodoptera litura]